MAVGLRLRKQSNAIYQSLDRSLTTEAEMTHNIIWLTSNSKILSRRVAPFVAANVGVTNMM